MTTLVKIGIGVAVVATAVTIIPALKGPYNRLKNNISENLDAEYVVDNYKVEFVKLDKQRREVLGNLNKFKTEIKVLEKKMEFSDAKLNAAKQFVKTVGTSNLVEFARARDAYELSKVERENYNTMHNVYSQAVVKLEKSLNMINSNMAKAKLNVDTLSSKKTLLDTIKSVNGTIANINCVGDGAIATNVEKLDDDVVRESIKLEALDSTTTQHQTMSEAEAKAYIDSLK